MLFMFVFIHVCSCVWFIFLIHVCLCCLCMFMFVFYSCLCVGRKKKERNTLPKEWICHNISLYLINSRVRFIFFIFKKFPLFLCLFLFAWLIYFLFAWLREFLNFFLFKFVCFSYYARKSYTLKPTVWTLMSLIDSNNKLHDWSSYDHDMNEVVREVR